MHTVQAMKAAGQEMKGFMKDNNLKIENIEKLHDDMSDMLVGRSRLLVPQLPATPKLFEQQAALCRCGC